MSFGKKYLGKAAAAVAFYDPAADGLAAAQWLLSEQPEDLDQGLDVAAAQVQLAQTFDVFRSGDFAVDTEGSLWQATAVALTASGGNPLRTVRVVRIGPGAKVVAEAGFSYLLLETGDRVLLETGGGILLEASGVRIVAGSPDVIGAGDVLVTDPLDGNTDRTTRHTVSQVAAQLAVGAARAYVLTSEA